MRSYRNVGKGLFSLLELTVILGVLGVVATIVGPRMTRAAAASPRMGEQVLTGQLAALRSAVVAYARDHGGLRPDGDPARIVRQLTQFTDPAGEPSPTRSRRYSLGPYLREIPTLPLSARRGSDKIARASGPVPPDVAWLYDPSTGQFQVATPPSETDAVGRPYCQY